MGFSRNHPARISISWEASTVHHLLFLVAVLWIAHFFCFRSFGLYEDDYAVISTPLSWDLSRVLSDLQQEIATLPLGRPIGFFLTLFLAFLAGKIGGLRTAYIFGFLVQVTNVCLFYFLIKKISLETIAFIGALAFGLFPADTTHIFLTHSLG